MRTKLVFVLAVLGLVMAALVVPAAAQEGTRAEQGLAFLEANKIPPEAFRDLSAAGRNPQEIAAVLTKYGYTSEQVQQFLTPQNIMALSSVVNPGAADKLVGDAMALLAPYKLSAADLDALLPVVNNPQAMMEVLLKKGLSAEQAQTLLQQAAPLIQDAGNAGMLQFAMLTQTLGDSMEKAGIPMAVFYEASQYLNDPEALAAYLKEKGYNDQQIQNIQGAASMMAAQGITGEKLDGYTAKNMIYRLEGLGLPTQSINDILALGNLDAIKAYLEEQGLSGAALQLALVNIEGVMGPNGEVMNLEKLAAVQSAEAAEMLAKAGIDPADLGDILALKDDPEALKELLADYGLDETAAADFMKGLEQSTFAKTVDPDDAEDFLANVEEKADEISLDEGEGDVSGGDEVGGEEQGGEDQSGGEQEGGSDQGGEDQGGGEQEGGADQGGGEGGGESGGEGGD